MSTISRHRIANRMLIWRSLHTVRLWVGVRVAPLIISLVFAPGIPLQDMGSVLFVPTGIDAALLFSTVTTAVDWVDEKRLSLTLVYANLGYTSLAMRMLVLGSALAAEAMLNLLMALVR